VAEVLVEEGDFVAAGQVVARMDAEVLEAQRNQAEAQVRQAESAVATARSQVGLREAEKAAAVALLAQREAERAIANAHRARSRRLVETNMISRQQLDDDLALAAGADAAVSAVQAQVVAAEAAIATARTQAAGAEEAVAAARATVRQIQTEIEDGRLKAPRSGRIQYVVARAGEVVGAGGRVLNMVDLGDVYMTFFLPTAAAGRLAVGGEARIVLDAVPEYVIPANISFVADVAQFTPKTVETTLEREKLMFRVRARIPRDLLEQHLDRVKTGLPGVAYVLLDPAAGWPEHLQVRLPE
jgi:HlyD family secretion protein